ncbi:recombination protein RecR [Candidatus Parcubacteria bacterium]|nr:recombination protein RecR [Candidatus Parcubacteria bacterium]
MLPVSLQKLISIFTKFPTIGQRTATRFVFYLLRLPKDRINELISAIQELREKIRSCDFCFYPFESNLERKLCDVCQNARRNKTQLCIVEKETDLDSIEKTKKYNGLYFILGGTIAALKKQDMEKLRIKELIARITKPTDFGLKETEFQEIILALNLTAEGEATSLYLERNLKFLNKKITRLGRGLPIGGEVEYADEETLSSALEGRKQI